MNDEQKKWLSDTPVGEQRAIECAGVRYEVDRRTLPTPWPTWWSNTEPYVVTKGGQTWVNPDGVVPLTVGGSVEPLTVGPQHPVIGGAPPNWRA